VSFNINGNESYKTGIGVFLSFGVLGLLLLVFIYYLLSYLDTTNPAIATKILTLSNYPDIYLNGFDFFIALILKDGP
jgi:hypothetical protein